MPPAVQDESEEEDIEFEDVELPAPVIQTTERDSDDSDDEMLFEDIDLSMVDLGAAAGGVQTQNLELNLSAHQAAAATSRKAVGRKKAVTKAERERRVDIHKMHVLCLLAHASRRNRWCNDVQVHESLLALLTDKMVTYLNPGANLSQFGRTESLKNGLQQVSTIFTAKFAITERGMKRALWAEEEEHLQNVRT